MKEKKKKSFDFTLLLHIIIVILIIVIIVAFFNIAGQKNVNQMVKNTENIYKEKLEDSEKISNEIKANKQIQKPKPYEKYDFKYNYVVNIKGDVKNLNIKIPLPSDENEKQYISGLRIFPSPTRTYHDGINNIAEYKFDRYSSGILDITLVGTANVRTYDLDTAKILNKNISKEKDLTKYLKPSFLIESEDGYVKRIAKRIKGKTKEEIVANIYEYTQNVLTYTPIQQDIGAREALRIRKGKCSEYAAVMTALCRAKNIPARIVCGNIARDTFQKHTWVEVYFDKYGWVAYDPTQTISFVNIYNNGKLVRKERRIISDKSNLRYIASSRNDFSPWYLTYSSYERTSSDMSVKENITIKKSKL